jgi:hypothetical protein
MRFTSFRGVTSVAQGGFISWQAAEKLARAVGRGFIPGTMPIQSVRALAPEVRFFWEFARCYPFSAACWNLYKNSSFERQMHPSHRQVFRQALG